MRKNIDIYLKYVQIHFKFPQHQSWSVKLKILVITNDNTYWDFNPLHSNDQIDLKIRCQFLKLQSFKKQLTVLIQRNLWSKTDWVAILASVFPL
jgi:hypothetical protein